MKKNPFEMEIQHKIERGILTLELSGDLDVSNFYSIEKYIKDIKKKFKDVCVDLEKVYYIDSVSIEYLMHLNNALKSRGATLTLLNLFGNMRRIFEVSGLEDFFKISNT